MPVINMEGAKLDKSQNQKFSDVGSEVTNIPVQAFVVLLEETDQDKLGTGCEMLSERQG